MNQKNQKGITLIALVITIIILLILAGVTINMVLGDDGIIARAQAATQKQTESERLEIIETTVAAQRINQLAGTGKIIDLERALKDNLNADEVEVTENNGEYTIVVTKNGETKTYKVDTRGKAKEIEGETAEEGLIPYVEKLKAEKGGESGFDTILLEWDDYGSLCNLTAKGFNFTYNGVEYTYILENNPYAFSYYFCVSGTWVDLIASGCSEWITTNTYDIKDNIVVEIPENKDIEPGYDLSSKFAGVILPSTFTDITLSNFQGR